MQLSTQHSGLSTQHYKLRPEQPTPGLLLIEVRQPFIRGAGGIRHSRHPRRTRPADERSSSGKESGVGGALGMRKDAGSRARVMKEATMMRMLRRTALSLCLRMALALTQPALAEKAGPPAEPSAAETKTTGEAHETKAAGEHHE